MIRMKFLAWKWFFPLFRGGINLVFGENALEVFDEKLYEYMYSGAYDMHRRGVPLPTVVYQMWRTYGAVDKTNTNRLIHQLLRQVKWENQLRGDQDGGQEAPLAADYTSRP